MAHRAPRSEFRRLYLAPLVAMAVANSSQDRLRTEERVVGGAGIAAFLVSLPLQFAADRALSHAVWWHNVRYGR